jgi:PhnB protein
MNVSPYLNFNGTCAEAFTFYQQQLGGTLLMQTFGETPMKAQVPADWQGKVVHANLAFGDNASVMGSDTPPNYYATPQGFSVSISVATAAEAERLFTGLSADGKVTMPFAVTFWSPGFGMLVDKFGIAWIVNTEPQAA